MLPPSPYVAVLPERVLLLMFTVPLLWMPPPSVVAVLQLMKP